jgi:hypothetical protein
VQTPGDTCTVTVDTLTTDTSDTDAQGNHRHAFTHGYISGKWFTGAISITTTDLDLTDVEVLHVSFDQVNDSADFIIDTYDISLYCVNSSAWFYSYLYSIDVDPATMTCDVAREATMEIPVADTIGDRYYRLRRGNLDVRLHGSSDGFWSETFMGPFANQYWEDITFKVWITTKPGLFPP